MEITVMGYIGIKVSGLWHRTGFYICDKRIGKAKAYTVVARALGQKHVCANAAGVLPHLPPQRNGGGFGYLTPCRRNYLSCSSWFLVHGE